MLKALQPVKKSQLLKAKSERIYIRCDIFTDISGTFSAGTSGAGRHAAYDARLMTDVQTIAEKLRRNPKLTLRPHYRNLLDAYEDEFVHGKGLRDEKLIAFFDRYVHDSLSGFARDATLPSDPRMLYVGGDLKMLYALDASGMANKAA